MAFSMGSDKRTLQLLCSRRPARCRLLEKSSATRGLWSSAQRKLISSFSTWDVRQLNSRLSNTSLCALIHVEPINPLALWSQKTGCVHDFLLATSRGGRFLRRSAHYRSVAIDRPHTALPGVAEHFIAYYSTALAFAPGFRSKASRVGIALGLALLAGPMEILQLRVPGRHSAILDAVVSSLGGV
jgi:hypothetical protein